MIVMFITNLQGTHRLLDQTEVGTPTEKIFEMHTSFYHLETSTNNLLQQSSFMVELFLWVPIDS